MTNAELRELVHLLMMCGIMDKTATESGNVTNEEWLRMKNLIDKYQAEKEVPEVKGDLISRSALLARVDEERKYLIARGQTGAEHILVKNFRDLIDNAPTVKNEYMRGYEAAEREYKRPQGEWIKVRPFLHKCSICGRTLKDVFDDELASDYPFCHCGADMRGKDE